jgi:predicted enzyme related to lactoylglutathione lyase
VEDKVSLKIKLTSVLVDDQDKALKFYTEVWAFSPDGPKEIELLLEPNDNPAAKAFQAALREQGIPLTAFAVADIQEEYSRLKRLGVVFRGQPAKAGTTTGAVFEDTCGNLIQLYQE